MMPCRQIQLIAAGIILSAGGIIGGGALELTPANWAEHTEGKTLFIKFFAPWCGHCKKIKPDWDRLTADFEGSPTALIAHVDCTKDDGKVLCDQNGVTGFPRLMWGKAGKLEIYSGGRSYPELRQWADDFVGTSCGPAHMEVCDPERRALMEKFMAMSNDKLDAKIKKAEKEIEAAETKFMDVQWNETIKLDKVETKKDKRIKAIRKGGLAEAKLVDKWNKETGRVAEPEESLQQGFLSFLQESIFEIGGVPVTGATALLMVLCLLLLAVVKVTQGRKDRPDDNGLKCWCLAKHILLKEETEILKALERIEAKESFEKVAEDVSMCPSGKSCGGAVGPFGPGSCQPEFEKVCWDPATQIDKVYGPIKTKHGFHLIIVKARKGTPEVAKEEKTEDDEPKEEKKTK